MQEGALGGGENTADAYASFAPKVLKCYRSSRNAAYVTTTYGECQRFLCKPVSRASAAADEKQNPGRDS